MIGGQRERPIEEQRLPKWQRDWIDSDRQKALARRLAEPELYAQLDRIEAKLDQLLK